jgi:TonB family protein
MNVPGRSAEEIWMMKSTTARPPLAGAICLMFAVFLFVADVAASGAGKVYTLSELVVVKQVPPRFPDAAVRGGFEGWVDVEFTVAPDGRVQDVAVTASSSRIFHREALAAILSWHFEPVRQEGRPIAVRVAMRFTFRGE